MKRAYVLCSGLGNKMWPFTDVRPKCCIPVGNVPNILRIIKDLRKCGIDEIYAVTGYKSSQINYALRNEKDVIIIYEEKSSGSAASLLYALGKAPASAFLVVYGDTVIDLGSMKGIIADNEAHGQCVMVDEIKGDIKPQHWICANVSQENINAVYGHPRPHYVNTRVAGIFALDDGIIPYLKCNPGIFASVPVGGMPSCEASLEQSIQIMIEEGHSFYPSYVKGYCVDMDRPWDILEANKYGADEVFSSFTGDDVASDSHIDGSALIEGRIRLGSGSIIGRNVMIKGDIYIGDHTIIDNGAILEGKNIIGSETIIKDYSKVWQYTIIGNKNKIGFTTEVCGITFDGVCAIHGCELAGVIGGSTDIAAGCITGSLRFDDRPAMHNVASARTEGNSYSSGVYIGDYTRTGVSNVFYPGVKIGAYCAIGPGVIVDGDIDSGTMVLAKQEKVYKKWGPEKYGW